MNAARLRLPLAVLFLFLSACGKDAPAPSASGAAAPAAPGPAAPAVPTATASPKTFAEALAAMPKGAVISDQWYEIRDDGRKSGWYHMVWTRSEFEGTPSIHDRTEQMSVSTRLMAGQEDVFEARSVNDLERDADGMLLSLRSETTQGERVTVFEQRREPGKYVSTQRVERLTETREVKTDALLPVDAEAYLAPIIRAGRIETGAAFSFPAAEFSTGKLLTVRLAVEAKETIATPAGSAVCWRVKETVDGKPGTQTWWLDEAGVLARVRSEATLVQRTTEDRARELDASAAAYSITLSADPELPRCTSLSRCVVDVSIRRADGMELPDFPVTPFSREVSRTGDTIRMELTEHDDPSATVALPVADASLAKCLESTNLYSPQDRRVKGALASALSNVAEKDRADGRIVTRAILRHVFRFLRKQSGPIPQPTAPEIVDAAMGDCSEHAVLFVAMCRAAGLPARRLSGYAQVGDMWGAHSFCEVWLGKWVGADPTTNELGTRARYVAFGWDEDPESFPGLVSGRVTDRMEIRTVEFTDGGTTMTVEEASKRKPLRDDRAGLVFAEPPKGWSVRLGGSPGHASVEGPGVTARIQVSAGMGDLDADLMRTNMFGSGRTTTFGGAPALRVAGGFMGLGKCTYAISWRRRTLIVAISIEDRVKEAAAVATLEALLAPSLTDPVTGVGTR